MARSNAEFALVLILPERMMLASPFPSILGLLPSLLGELDLHSATNSAEMQLLQQ
jgi:hypothetical protein